MARRFGQGTVVLAALCLCGPVAAARADADGAKIAAEQMLPSGGIELTITTPTFAAPTKVEVFLPAGYDADRDRRWPVTYYLHGMQGDQTRFFPWYGDLIKTFPSIVVSPDGGPAGFYSDWFNNGAGGAPMYETYDIRQLIPLIDQRFRTFGTRAERAVIGESMGGYGVMTLAARHPDMFAAAASLSGAVDSNYAPFGAVMSAGPMLQSALPDSIYGPRATNEIRWHGHNPTDLAANLRDVDLQVRWADGSPNPPLYPDNPPSVLPCTLEAGIYNMNLSFRAQLTALGIPHIWKDYGAGCHDTTVFRPEFADSLPRIETVFEHPQPAPTSFDYESIEPQFDIWGWHIAADPQRALEFLALDHVGRDGLTLTGSGSTSVATPPLFPVADTVDVTIMGVTTAVKPDADGRLHFTVDLGAPHTDAQDTPAAMAAGGYFSTRTVRFSPQG